MDTYLNMYRIYDNFEMDLSELDCIHDSNPNTMNDELIKKIT